jgi:hypothetical protein
MTKYITIEDSLYEAFLVIQLEKINDEVLPVNRKDGDGADKNQFYIQGKYYQDFKSFFPLVYQDKQDNKTGRNSPTLKNFFNISSLVNDIDFVNNELSIKYPKESLIDKSDYYANCLKISKRQNFNTVFFIESMIAYAQNGIGFKNWKEDFKKLIKVLLLPTTQLKVYLFNDKSNNICAFWEFHQEYTGGVLAEKTETSDLVSRNTIYYGAPGTGKSHIVNELLDGLDKNRYERITFHPEFDNSTFIGGYKPVSAKDDDGKDIIKYQFVPQAFTNIYERAWQDPVNQYYLVIEEINRGNCAEIFGEVFQLLDRASKYTVSPSKELKEYLKETFKDDNHDGIINGLKLPPNLSILATMNTSDQSLFPMDSAFKRRWDWEYVPICYTPVDEKGEENKSFNFEIDIEDGHKYSWINFIEKINLNHIKMNESLGMDKCIGNYFIKPDKGNVISLKPFINKVIFYLWNDVFKDEDNKVFEEKTSYEDFFPIDSKGKEKIKDLFKRIELLPSVAEKTVYVEEAVQGDQD